MKQIRDLIKLPSQALDIMCDGLEAQSKREGFKVNMDYFYKHEAQTCFGCAATCFLQQVTNTDLPTNMGFSDSADRGVWLDLERMDMLTFEDIMDDVRCWEFWWLFGYFGFDFEPFFKLVNTLPEWSDNEFFLRTTDWEEQLPKVRAIAKIMRDNDY